MRKPLVIGLFVSALAGGINLGAFGQGEQGGPGGGCGQPERPLRRLMEGGGQGGFRHGMGNRPPGARRVMALSSLSQDQRQKLESIYKSEREQMKPLIEQRKQMRAQLEQGGGPAVGCAPGGAVGGGPAMGGLGQIRPLMQQMRSIHEGTWSKAQAVLTPAQISELQQAGPGPQGMHQMPGGPSGHEGGGPQGGGGQMQDDEE